MRAPQPPTAPDAVGQRYGPIDHNRLMDLSELKSRQDLEQLHKAWIDEGLAKGNPFREDRWTESLAGGEDFVKEIRNSLGFRAIGRSIIENGEQQQLRDVQQPYNGRFDPEKDRLSKKTGLKWSVFPDS